MLQFHVQGAPVVTDMTFGDSALEKRVAGVQQHLAEMLAKRYSRATIDLFLAERSGIY